MMSTGAIMSAAFLDDLMPRIETHSNSKAKAEGLRRMSEYDINRTRSLRGYGACRATGPDYRRITQREVAGTLVGN